jgi:hypothetical protein
MLYFLTKELLYLDVNIINISIFIKKLTMPSRVFIVGSIVTLKSHPLFIKHTIDIFSNQVPPLMIVKEVIYENDKKKLFSDELEDCKIADDIKYICIYFNNNKSEFVEVTVYHSFLKNYDQLKFNRQLDEKGKATRSEISLIDEVKNYKSADYEFGSVVRLKTNKLERRKTFNANFDTAIKVSFTSPDFILTGLKKEILTDLFYHDGKPKRKASDILYKVMWYNHFQQKFSEQYLPKEFFVEDFPNLDSDNEFNNNREIINPSKDSENQDFDSGLNN